MQHSYKHTMKSENLFTNKDNFRFAVPKIIMLRSVTYTGNYC